MKTILQGIRTIETACFEDPWSESVLADCLLQPHYVWETAERDGRLVAYGCGSVSLDEGEILRVAVLPAYRRLGLGEQVVAGLLRQMAARKVTRVLLEVRASNVPAQALYCKMGFAALAVRKGYYPDGEDAVIMERL